MHDQLPQGEEAANASVARAQKQAEFGGKQGEITGALGAAQEAALANLEAAQGEPQEQKEASKKK